MMTFQQLAVSFSTFETSQKEVLLNFTELLIQGHDRNELGSLVSATVFKKGAYLARATMFALLEAAKNPEFFVSASLAGTKKTLKAAEAAASLDSTIGLIVLASSPVGQSLQTFQASKPTTATPQAAGAPTTAETETE